MVDSILIAFRIVILVDIIYFATQHGKILDFVHRSEITSKLFSCIYCIGFWISIGAVLLTALLPNLNYEILDIVFLTWLLNLTFNKIFPYK